MAEFKAANLWVKLALWMIDISILLDLFGHSVGQLGAAGSTRSCLVGGFICILVAFVLIQCYVFLNELNGNKIVLICVIVFALIAGLLFAIGIALNAGYTKSALYNRFSGNLIGWAALTALLGGIFAILEIVGVKG